MLVGIDVVGVVASGAVVLEVAEVLAVVSRRRHVDAAVLVPGGHAEDIFEIMSVNLRRPEASRMVAFSEMRMFRGCTLSTYTSSTKYPSA